MIDRCHLRRHHPEFWRYYGALGVVVCDRWRNDFSAFLADMGERPAGTTLDRFPNNRGNYESGNCRWATLLEQAANKPPRILKGRWPLDLTGIVFTRLTVIGQHGQTPAGVSRWDCRCECGEVTTVARGNLTSASVKSCGCFRAHGRQRDTRGLFV